MELIWTAIPTVIVLIMFAVSMLALANVEARSPRPYVTIEVYGFQWQWAFVYLDEDDNPDNDVVVTGTPNRPPAMVVPVGQPVHLVLHSEDVIHSFFVRNFLIKRDVIPVGPNGTPNSMEFTVTEAGTYSGQCAEFCGDLHAGMTFSVEALPQADFDDWLAAARAGETPEPSESPPASGPPPSGPPPSGPPLVVVHVAAQDISFDVQQLSAPAGEAFVIEFDNQDSVPHNVSIYQGDAEIFTGDYFTGPGTIRYEVPALEAGEYTFICDVHPVPAMTGTLTVD